MDSIVKRTGFWSSMISVFSILVWFVSFIAIAVKQPLFYWTDAPNYFEHVNQNSQFFQDLAKAFMLIFSISFLILTFSLYELLAANRRFAGRIGLVFLTLFTAYSSLHYFVQISMVRLNLGLGHTDGLASFLQADPLSYSSAVNMLGWTLMLGIASFFLALMFAGKGTKWFRILFFLNAFFAFAALLGFMIQYDPLTFLAINMGVGGCITILSIKGIMFFRRKEMA